MFPFVNFSDFNCAQVVDIHSEDSSLIIPRFSIIVFDFAGRAQRCHDIICLHILHYHCNKKIILRCHLVLLIVFEHWTNVLIVMLFVCLVQICSGVFRSFWKRK